MKRILVVFLDWGIGHFTRSIPIITELLSYKNVEITLGTTESTTKIVQKTFPQIKTLLLPGYNIKYSKYNTQILKIISLIPKICKTIYLEHKLLNNIHNQYDIIISDNRFGMWNKNIYSIYISHQITIKIPKSISYLQNIVNKINSKFINKYNELWIPDSPTNKLSGELSSCEHIKIPIKYLGYLSQFTDKIFENNHSNYIYEIIVILSGPEPQRTIFENIIVSELLKYNKKSLIVQGIIKSKSEYIEKSNISFVNFLNATELLQAINRAKYIICRSGYSSVMDLATIGRTAILVPTPGQTEQEYLAKYLSNQHLFYSVAQSNFNCEDAIKHIKNYNINNNFINTQNYKQIINNVFI